MSSTTTNDRLCKLMKMQQCILELKIIIKYGKKLKRY